MTKHKRVNRSINPESAVSGLGLDVKGEIKPLDRTNSTYSQYVRGKVGVKAALVAIEEIKSYYRE